MGQRCCHPNKSTAWSLTQSSSLNESRLKLLVVHCLLAATSKKPYNLNIVVVKLKYKDGKQCSSPRWGRTGSSSQALHICFGICCLSTTRFCTNIFYTFFLQALGYQIQYTTWESTSNYWLRHFCSFQRTPTSNVHHQGKTITRLNQREPTRGFL